VRTGHTGVLAPAIAVRRSLGTRCSRLAGATRVIASPGEAAVGGQRRGAAASRPERAPVDPASRRSLVTQCGATRASSDMLHLVCTVGGNP
jgi:hypothetical protein